MRIKDSPKSNAEGSGKKEGKKKNSKQKGESKGAASNNKNEKHPNAGKTDKDTSKLSPAKNDVDNEVCI